MWLTLCAVFESPFGIIALKIQNLCFAFHATYLRFTLSYMHLFQFNNEYSFFIKVEQHFRGTLGSKHAITNKTYMRKMKTNINVKMLYFFRRSWTVTRRILIGMFYSQSRLKKIKLIFSSFSAIWICIQSQNLKNEKIRMISICS